MVIVTVFDEADAMLRLNEWCAEHDERYDDGQTFAGLIRPAFGEVDTQDSGGAKVLGSRIWAMCGNYFPHWDLIVALPTFRWSCPAGVVLTVSTMLDDEPQIGVYRADGDRIERRHRRYARLFPPASPS